MNASQIYVNGRCFKLRYNSPQCALQLPWSMTCRVDGEGNDGAAEFFKALEGSRLAVVFCIPALGLVQGLAFCDARPLLVNGDVSLAFTGVDRLSQIHDWPQHVASDEAVAHGVTMGMVEQAVRDTVVGMCPPDATVTVRGTERARGLGDAEVIIQMWVGGAK